ncbi:MAG: hypothetical protein M1836_003058 [Candelina mexicana]|nr:MAG: hypothetical protein M1836_003058 [Candelina mexicana]
MEAAAALGVASSCITFVDAGIKVFKVVAEPLRSTDGAIGWVRDLLVEVESLTRILEQVHDSLLRYECTKTIEARLEALLQDCEQQALLLKDTLDGLTIRPSRTSGDGLGERARDVLRRTWKAGLTVVEEGKIKQLKDGLAHLRDNVQLQLSVIGLDLTASQLEAARNIQDSVSPIRRDIKSLTSPIFGLSKAVEEVDHNVRQVEKDIIEVRSGVGIIEKALPDVEAKVQTLLDLGANTNDGMLVLQKQVALLTIEANAHLNRQLLRDPSALPLKSKGLEYPSQPKDVVAYSNDHQTRNGFKSRADKIKRQCSSSCICRCHDYQRAVADCSVGNANRLVSFMSSLFTWCSVRTCRIRKTEWALQLPSSCKFSPSVESQVVRLGFEASRFRTSWTLSFHSILDVNTSRTFQVISDIADNPDWTADSTIRQLQGIFDRGEGSPHDRYSNGYTILSLAWSTILFTVEDDVPASETEAEELFKWLLLEGCELEHGATCSQGFRNIGIIFCDVPDVTLSSRRRSTQFMLDNGWEPLFDLVPPSYMYGSVQASRLMRLKYIDYVILCSYFCEDIVPMPTAIDSALASAVLRSDIPTAKRLLGRGANVNATATFSKETILHLGLTSSPAMLSYLLSHRPHLNAINNGGYTPLLKAAYLSLPEPALKLLDAGASITTRSYPVLFPSHRRTDPNPNQMEQCILFSKTMIEWFETKGRLSELKENLTELLAHSAGRGQVELCRLYLAAGADPRMGDVSQCLDEEVKELLRSYECRNGENEGGDEWASAEEEEDDADDDVFFDVV